MWFHFIKVQIGFLFLAKALNHSEHREGTEFTEINPKHNKKPETI